MRILGIDFALPAKDGVVYLALGGATLIFTLLRLITASSATKCGLYVAIVLGALLAFGGYQKYKAAA